MGADDFQRAGLYDPDAPGAADRLALLEWLVEQGFTLAEIEAEAEAQQGTLNRLAADRAVRPGERLPTREVARRAGVTMEELATILHTAGLPVPGPDDLVFTADDEEIFTTFSAAMAWLGEIPTLQFTRVMGSSLAAIAEAAVRVFLVNKEDPLYGASASELDHARLNLEGTTALQVIPRAMDRLFLSHFELAVRRSRQSRTDDRSPHTARLAVGFVDLVGFTPLSGGLSTFALAALVEEFEARAFSVVTEHGGRVVKFIGDEVMFVTVSPEHACEIALRLVERFRDDGSGVQPRGGVAFGELVARGGDYYGPVVNAASRIGALAIPDEVLVTAEVRDSVLESGSPLVFDPAGRRNLKGFAEPVELLSVREP